MARDPGFSLSLSSPGICSPTTLNSFVLLGSREAGVSCPQQRDTQLSSKTVFIVPGRFPRPSSDSLRLPSGSSWLPALFSQGLPLFCLSSPGLAARPGPYVPAISRPRSSRGTEPPLQNKSPNHNLIPGYKHTLWRGEGLRQQAVLRGPRFCLPCSRNGILLPELLMATPLPYSPLQTSPRASWHTMRSLPPN